VAAPQPPPATRPRPSFKSGAANRAAGAAVFSGAAAQKIHLFALDLETTGLSPQEDRVTEIAVVGCSDRSFEFVTFVNPGRRNIPPHIQRVTGISNADVRGAGVPGFAMAVVQLEAMLAKHCGESANVVLAIHNGRTFDVPFLVAEYARSGRTMPSNWRFVDTLEVSRAHLQTRVANHKLATLASHFKADTAGAHRARADAIMLRTVIDGMRPLLPKGIDTMSFRVHSAPRASEKPPSALTAVGALSSRLGPEEAAEAEEDLALDDAEPVDEGEEEEESSSTASKPARPSPRPHKPKRQAVLTSTSSARAAADPLLAGTRVFYEDGELQLLASGPVPWAEIPLDATVLDVKDAKDMSKRFGSLERLLRHYPKKFVLYSEWHSGLCVGSKAIADGHVVTRSVKPLNDRALLRIEVQTAAGVVAAEMWRQMSPSLPPAAKAQVMSVLTNSFKEGESVCLMGTVARGGHLSSVVNDVARESLRSLAAVGHYISTDWPPVDIVGSGKLSQKRWDRVLSAALDASKEVELRRGDWLAVALGDATLANLQLLGGAAALRALHRPESHVEVVAARRRLAFEELFLLQLHLLSSRQKLLAAAPAVPCHSTGTVDELISLLAKEEFELTPGQRCALDEVLGDIAGSTPMLRLLMGDVGCGKTIVAFLALLAAHEAGVQAVLLAPSTILASQHFNSLQEKYLRKLPPLQQPKVQLLSTELSGAERAAALAGIASGQVHIVIGTHSLLQPDVVFSRLGMVIVDEEHRFGVEQRELLRRRNEDGTVPHLLTLSATPIPRSLALTAYGDFALSIIAEKPHGRGAVVKTEAREYGPGARAKVWDDVRAEVKTEVKKEGGRVFIIYPRVNSAESGSETLDAVQAFEELSSGPLSDISVGLVHGSMSSKDKSAAIAAFAAGDTSVLVATKVVEVGVDISAATARPRASCSLPTTHAPPAQLLVVEHAESFGLAELHQMRGRVGRGKRPGRCILLYKNVKQEEDGKLDETSENVVSVAAQRMQAMECISDGFEIADEDLRLRGPGPLLGSKQSGRLPYLTLASLTDDKQLADSARELAALQVLRAGSDPLPSVLRYALDSRKN